MDRSGAGEHEVGISKRERFLVGGVVLLYLALTSWLSWELNVWRDEMYSLHTSAGSVGHAARQAIDFELQPPVYFALLAAWRTFHDSIFFARTLSAVFGAGAIVTVAVLSRRLVPSLHPAYAAALVATHPFVVWAGTEIRVYALVVLLSTLLGLTFVRAYWVGPARPRARLAFAAVALVALYTQYYLSVLLFSFGVALLVRRERARVVAYAMDAAAVALLSVPLVLAIRAQLGTHRADLGHSLPLGAEAIRRVAARFEAYAFSFNEAIDKSAWARGTIRAARWSYRGLIVALVIAGVWKLRRPRAVPGALATATAFGAYAVCMLALFMAVGPMSVGERHTAGLVVPAILATAALPAAIGRGAYAWAALLLGSNVAATALAHVVPLAKDCDCRHVAEAIRERETTREPILVFPAEDVLPLGVYYHGPNRLLPVPAAPSYESWDQSTFVIRSPDDVARIVETEAPGSTGLWVHTNTYGPHWGPDKLEAFLARDYRESGKFAFERGVVLRHFVRQEASPTSIASP
jgi:hypothetical protein